MRKLVLIAMLLVPPAIAKPNDENNRSILLMAAALVEMAEQDGVIDQREEALLKQEFPLQERANPIAVFTLDKSDLIKSISSLNLNKRKSRGFLTFLGLVALVDERLSTEEKKMLDRARSVLDPKLSHEKLIASAKNLQRLILRREVKGTLKAIVSAQQYNEKQGIAYVPAAIYPTPSKSPIQNWIKADSGGFKDLNWTPPPKVAGAYWIVADERTFEVTGIIDADGDGSFATYIATKDSPSPTKTTADKVQ